MDSRHWKEREEKNRWNTSDLFFNDTVIMVHPLPTLSSYNTRNYSTHGHHQMVNTKIRLIIFFCSQGQRSSIQSAKIRLGTDCGSDHELLTAKFRLKLKKVGKTTRPFKYDLNQIPYDYTVKVRNRLGLDLIECLKNFRRRFVTL